MALLDSTGKGHSPELVLYNLHNGSPKVGQNECCFRVDRKTPLGNPFEMKNKSNEERNRVCDEYEKWFAERLKGIDTPFIRCLNSLAQLIVGGYTRIYLLCWCAPQRCHSETIRAFIERDYNGPTR